MIKTINSVTRVRGRAAIALPEQPPRAYPAQSGRSRVPDLLFEDQQEERLAEIGPLLEVPEMVSAATPLHRLTVFLTFRCNLRCLYCKTVARDRAGLGWRAQPCSSFDISSFERLLAANAGTPLRHLHFTGGEASLVPGLAAMIRMARRYGVECLSLTTNGTLPARRYLELIDAGLDELRLSLDAADPEQGRALTRRPGAWSAAVRTLRTLAGARRRGKQFFLIVNSVVGRFNRHLLARTVRFLLGFDPDDIKLITEVEGRDQLGDFPQAAAVRAQLEKLLSGYPQAALPLLRRKLRTVFAPDAIGLESECPPPGRAWRCHIPLTERTVDNEFYYPCSVYLREGGAPLGRLTDPPDLQRQRSARFVRESHCLDDRICRRYCLYCTRTFNSRANAEYR